MSDSAVLQGQIDFLRAENVSLVERIAYLDSALQEIAKGSGAFSRDPLIHADNCITHMVEVANAALARTWKEDKMYCQFLGNECLDLDNALEENERLHARIAELEAAAQWHPACEPPKLTDHEHLTRFVLGIAPLANDDEEFIFIVFYDYKNNEWIPFLSTDMGFDKMPVTHWRDLPPMPVKETRRS